MSKKRTSKAWLRARPLQRMAPKMRSARAALQLETTYAADACARASLAGLPDFCASTFFLGQASTTFEVCGPGATSGKSESERQPRPELSDDNNRGHDCPDCGRAAPREYHATAHWER